MEPSVIRGTLRVASLYLAMVTRPFLATSKRHAHLDDTATASETQLIVLEEGG